MPTFLDNPPRFLDNPPRFLFFTGKGGVGKTSLACASAVQLAESGRRVLLVSTDPASNVGQVFGIAIGNKITPLDSVRGLSCLEIDPSAAAQIYREKIVGPVRNILPPSAVQGIEEQLSGACTTEIAAFDEFTSLLTDASLVKDFDHILFDTAPTGHTIRLLQLPGAWNTFLEEGKGDASCLGPLAGLEKQRNQYRGAVDALCDHERTRLVLVTRAQASSLREANRTREELANIGLRNQFLVVNGVLDASENSKDPLALALFQREQTALGNMPSGLRSLPVDYIPLKSFNLVGLEPLRQFFSAEVGTDGVTTTALPQVDTPDLATLVDSLVGEGHGLVMLMGKGGVGKTTLAAAVAVELASRGFPVHLTTSDPAAHLTETLAGTLDNLTISRIDPHAETERYRQHVLQTKGKDLDAQGKALLEEDLRSPCTEEIAVFQAFSRIIREAGKIFVVMDTAPTGHTLLLLDATGAYHRETARQLGKSGIHFTTPMMQLQDSSQTKVLIVTLAENTPVLEAANLQSDLRRAGIEPWAWIINNSLAAANPRSGLLCRRALNEIPKIQEVEKQYAKRLAIVPLQAEEPIGINRLMQLSRHTSR